jgi:hypothetical protein
MHENLYAVKHTKRTPFLGFAKLLISSPFKFSRKKEQDRAHFQWRPYSVTACVKRPDRLQLSSCLRAEAVSIRPMLIYIDSVRDSHPRREGLCRKKQLCKDPDMRCILPQALWPEAPPEHAVTCVLASSGCQSIWTGASDGGIVKWRTDGEAFDLTDGTRDGHAQKVRPY